MTGPSSIDERWEIRHRDGKISCVRWVLAILSMTACGRLGFGERADAGPDGPVVFADFSSSFTYRSDDFIDGAAVNDNVPRSLCVLDPAFGSPLAVIAGRALIELSPPAAPVTHDFTPAAPNTTGPDELVSCRAVTVEGVGPAAWLAAGSLTGGDGLYILRPDWSLERANTANNVGGLMFDAAGTFTGTPDLLYASDGVIYARPAETMVRSIGMRLGDMATTRSGDHVGFMFDDSFTPFVLATFSATTLASTTLASFATEARIAVDTVAPAPYLAYGVVERRELVGFLADGTTVTLASSPDTASQWQAVAIPSAPHPLAGRVFVLEVNFEISRFRVLEVAID